MHERYFITRQQIEDISSSLENLRLGNVCTTMRRVCDKQSLPSSHADNPPARWFQSYNWYIQGSFVFTILSLISGIFVRFMLAIFILMFAATIMNTIIIFREERRYRKRGLLRYMNEVRGGES